MSGIVVNPDDQPPEVARWHYIITLAWHGGQELLTAEGLYVPPAGVTRSEAFGQIRASAARAAGLSPSGNVPVLYFSLERDNRLHRDSELHLDLGDGYRVYQTAWGDYRPAHGQTWLGPAEPLAADAIRRIQQHRQQAEHPDGGLR